MGWGVFWFIMWCLSLCLLAFARWKIERLQHLHEGCHQATLSALKTLSNRSKVRALTAAAEAYDSPGGRLLLNRLARARAGDPDCEPRIPALFMLEQAKQYEEGPDA